MKNSSKIIDTICEDCCGCTACSAVCPKDCITMDYCASGFYEARIDLSKCIHCDNCRRVCPQNSAPADTTQKLEKKYYFVAESKDKMVLSYSASGGAAFELSRSGIVNGWKVIGTIYNCKNDRAEWRIASSTEELSPFCGSKYIQSLPNNIIGQIDPRQPYIIIATPCQIAGVLKVIERKKWKRENFLLVDFHCHGTPSYNIWDNYISEVKKRMGTSNFLNVSFRNKIKGWHTFILRFDSENNVYYSNSPSDRNLFYDYFFGHSWFHECCLHCYLKGDTSFADIRLGDCWNKDYVKYKPGKSAVSVFSNFGLKFLKECTNLEIIEQDRNFVIAGQISHAAKEGRFSSKIQNGILKGTSISILRYLYIIFPNIPSRIIDKMKSLVSRK